MTDFVVSAPAAEAPPSIIPESCSAACEDSLSEHVGEIRLSDSAREGVIKDAAALVERHMAKWEATGCFAARGMADRARVSMEALIRGRSAAQVARMEAARGLA